MNREKILSTKILLTMDIQRQCVWCGKTYLAHGFGSRYCSSSCKNKAKRSKEKEEKERLEAVAPKLPEVKMVSGKEYLTASDVAALFGISLATVYRYAAKGVFKACKLNGVKLIVRKSDLEYLFDHAGPYKKRQYGRQDNKEYYTMNYNKFLNIINGSWHKHAENRTQLLFGADCPAPCRRRSLNKG